MQVNTQFFQNSIDGTLISFLLINGTIEVTYRFASNMVLGNGDPVPDKLVKKIYVANNDSIVLERQITGRVIPSRYVPEEFIFDEI